MPVKLDDSGKCVVEPSGKVVKCHDTNQQALDHMRAINANTEKGVNGFTVKQGKDGIWYWMSIVSNNWVDRDFQWISAKAHKSFVEKLDSGEFGPMVLGSWLTEMPGKVGQIFKEIGERGTPDLWYWHLPAPIGYATVVAYDERDYLIAMGQQKEGEFYSSVFKTIAESGVNHGMSHGMPNTFIRHNKDNERVIDDYISTEFTVLPDKEAANWGTAFSTTMKEAVMQVPKEKRERMTEIFGEETVASFDALLGELEIFAADSEIPRKEKTVMPKTTADAKVEEEDVEEVETEEVETEETDAEETDADDEVVAEASTESDDSEEEEDKETGMGMDPSEFQVPTDLKSFAEEMATALKEVVTDLQTQQNAQFQALEEKLEKQRAEIAKLKLGEDERIAAKAAETPVASMAGWLATEVGSVIGKEGARIHGNKDRELYNKTKAGEGDDEVASVPGVPKTIAAIITRQRSRGKMVRVTGDGQ